MASSKDEAKQRRETLREISSFGGAAKTVRKPSRKKPAGATVNKARSKNIDAGHHSRHKGRVKVRHYLSAIERGENVKDRYRG